LVVALTAASAIAWDWNFKVEQVDLGFNPILQHEPHPTNGVYYVLSASNVYTVSGTQVLTTYIGPCVRLTWDTQPNRTYVVQWATNGVWRDVRVNIRGTGQPRVWYDQLPMVGESKSWRVVVKTPAPPTSLRVMG
jgi:hypothetical protein